MFRRPPKRAERRRRAEPVDRPACAQRAVALFNAGRFWEAHEAVEAIWRSVADEQEARVLQGVIQAAAALLHRRRGNSHGTRVVGQAALEKLRGPQHAAVEFDTELLRAGLEQALRLPGAMPELKLRMQA